MLFLKVAVTNRFATHGCPRSRRQMMDGFHGGWYVAEGTGPPHVSPGLRHQRMRTSSAEKTIFFSFISARGVGSDRKPQGRHGRAGGAPKSDGWIERLDRDGTNFTRSAQGIRNDFSNSRLFALARLGSTSMGRLSRRRGKPRVPIQPEYAATWSAGSRTGAAWAAPLGAAREMSVVTK